MRGFVCIAGFALGGLGLAACGSVVPPTRGEDAATDGVSPGDSVDAAPLCAAPSGHPSTTSDISLFANADGHTGTDNTCPKVGVSYTTSNPQHVWCRRWGGLVSGSQGYNHWWIWTELDQPANAVGWISAYYIQGQGNDAANGIPDCP